MERQYYIDGLGCPNCAAKMETQVGKISGVAEATVSFVNKKLILNINNEQELDNIIEEAVKRMNVIEDNIRLIPYKEYKASLEDDYEEDSHNHHDEDHEHEGCCGHNHEDHEHEGCCGHDHHDEEEHEHGESCNHSHHNDNKKQDKDHDSHQGHNHEHGETSKLSITLLCIGVVILIGIIALTHFYDINKYIEIGTFVVAYLLVGYDVLFKSIKNILKGQVFDEFFLMSIATIGALAIGEYPEAVAVMLFYKVGEYFQDKAVDQARHSIKALVNIKPDYANVVAENGEIETVKPNKVKVGDIIEVKAGERVPLDGILVEGSTSLDTSAITGESKPQDVFEGDTIYSGAINKTGLIKIQVTKKFADSTVSRIMEMVENASDKKSHTEQFITKFARVYTPIVVFMALGIAVLPPIVTGSYEFTGYIYKALSFLVVSCPCALVISVPLGFFGGIGVASKNGILVKGGNYLEALANIKTVAFDKTGTLTHGIFEVTKIVPNKNVTKEELLLSAAYAEYKTNHPIAKSILDANTSDIDESNIISYEEISGYGIVANLKEATILAGNDKLMDKYNIEYSKANTATTVVYIAINNDFAGYICISDKIKDSSKIGIDNLRKAGVEDTILLSGDSKELVEEVASELGITHAYGQLLPQDKLSKIEAIYEENADTKLAFVGDGINDAPVLARADVGIAMGGVGQDAAIEAADIVLMTDEISKIADAIKISKFTRQIVTENIIFALGVKVLVLLLVVCGMSSMWMAVFADVGVALLAVLNSIRVYKYKLL